jgi:hypothetical protein
VAEWGPPAAAEPVGRAVSSLAASRVAERVGPAAFAEPPAPAVEARPGGTAEQVGREVSARVVV